MNDPTRPPPTAAGGQGRTLLVGGGLAVVLLLGIVAFLALSGGEPATPAAGDTAAGTPATPPPAFGLTDATAELPPATLVGFDGGEAVEVAELLGGRPLVLNFWGSWCAPCVAEMPDLQELHEAAGADLHLIGINTRDAPSNAQDFVAEFGITYDQVIDPQGAYFTATGSFGMPTTLFVRPDGSVAYRQTGPMTLQQMRDLTAEHLGVEVQSR